MFACIYTYTECLITGDLIGQDVILYNNSM